MAATALVSEHRPGAPKILVAQQDEQRHGEIARSLRARGYAVVEQVHGVSSVHGADSGSPHVALVDLDIPFARGLELVERLKREHGPELAVLVISGSSEPQTRLAAFNAGADDFVARPIDLTDLVCRIEALERSRQAYIRAEQERTQEERLRLYAAEACALIAHDINNGLATGIANLGFLDRTATLSEEGHDALASAIAGLGRLAGLVRNFVDVSRMEELNLTPDRAPVSLKNLLRSAISLHEFALRPKQAKADLECDADVVAMVDAALMERVAHNLLGNAARYVSEAGRVCVRLRSEAGGAPGKPPAAVIEIANTGEAVPEKLACNLFEKYRTGADSKAMRGMGLYFCRLACNAHGGSIALVADPVYSTCFRIHLPGAVCVQ